jgi:hypothetical protein
MKLPPNFPNNPHTARNIQTLLTRVRRLSPAAKERLSTMLDEEMDLPYLDTMEREYAKFFRQVAPERATMLRGRFVRALNVQRDFLVGLVRKVLQEPEGNELHLPDDPPEKDG